MSDFFDAIRRFLLDYLPKQRCLSKNTILSYRQTLNIFVAYMRDEIGIGAAELTFSRVDRDVILNFLTWLEKARGCSVSTRNQRLMALRSFLDFAGQIDCTQTSLYLSACNIPSKEAHGRIVEFLTEPALTALLQQPNPSRQKDQRNLVFMILMYDTAARCSELLDMKACDLRLDAKHPIAYLHGKGRKTRTVPLLNRTVQHCKQYLNKFHPNKDDYSEAPLFYTVIHGRQQKMSPDIREMKSVFARRIYHADRMHIYQQKDIARQELQTRTRKAMVECIAQLEHGTSDNPRLEQLTEELAERLLTIKGRKVYGYLPPRVKAIVDAIVEELAKDERVSAAYETWQTLYEQVCLDYDQRPPKRLPLSQQKEFRSVRNMVIQETLQWIAERQQYADAQKSSAMLTESISPENSAPTTRAKVEFTASAVPAQPQAQNTPAPSTEDTGSSDAATSKDAAPPVGEMTPTHSQPSGQAGQTALAGADYRAPTVGETVVRMLHHMSRIFEDNSKIDQIHRGLQIDRKRRQELQRKRLAMGHKPDDHEEQTFR